MRIRVNSIVGMLSSVIVTAVTFGFIGQSAAAQVDRCNPSVAARPAVHSRCVSEIAARRAQHALRHS